MIEIVSPGNKNTRHAMSKFIEKAAEFLDAGMTVPYRAARYLPSRHVTFLSREAMGKVFDCLDTRFEADRVLVVQCPSARADSGAIVKWDHATMAWLNLGFKSPWLQ